MNTHTSMTSKQWVIINKLRKEARSKLVNRNKLIMVRWLDKKQAEKSTSEALAAFDSFRKHIKNRNITLLDEAIADFVVDNVYDLDNQESVYVLAMMELYNEITGYRA
jgi:hypothetical protein